VNDLLATIAALDGRFVTEMSMQCKDFEAGRSVVMQGLVKKRPRQAS